MRSCGKWRKLPANISPDTLPEEWHCSMITWDKYFATCAAAEEEGARSSISYHCWVNVLDVIYWLSSNIEERIILDLYTRQNNSSLFMKMKWDYAYILPPSSASPWIKIATRKCKFGPPCPSFRPLTTPYVSSSILFASAFYVGPTTTQFIPPILIALQANTFTSAYLMIKR